VCALTSPAIEGRPTSSADIPQSPNEYLLKFYCFRGVFSKTGAAIFGIIASEHQAIALAAMPV
jgi:hypothetical protein